MKDTREKMYKAPWRPFSGKGVAALALAAVLTAGAASCRKDNDTASSPTGTVGFRATAEAHSGEGKTYLDEFWVKWHLYDAVMVCNGNGTSKEFNANNLTDDGKTADLVESGDSYTYAAPYSAVYPYRGSLTFNNSDRSFSGFTFDGTQAYSANGFADGANPMAAYLATDPSEGTPRLDFKNLCGLLKVSLTGNSNVKSIRITALGENAPHLWGTYSIVLDNNEYKLSESASGGDNTLVMTFGKNLSQAATDFYFVLPPVTMPNGFMMEALNSDEKVVGRKSVSKPIEIKKSFILSMNLLDMSLPENLAGSDDKKTANCYIAPTSGEEYMFPCYIKGNGIPPTGECTNHLSPDQMEANLSGYKDAALVWQTYNDDNTNPTEVVTSVSLVGDYVHFTRGTHDGNALIAVYDEAGYENGIHKGNILWSWHVWCVDDYDDTNNYYEAFGLGDNPKLMDRNLGALSNKAGEAKTAGLFYQWGRKDPLFGPADYKNESSPFMNRAEKKILQTIDNEPSNNVANTIKQPDAFALNIEEANDYDWFSKTGNLSDGLWGEDKTMYDPCPYGWKVPEIGEVTSNGENMTVTNHTWGTENVNWENSDPENKGKKFIDGNNNESFYPLAGNLYSGNGVLNYVGTRCSYWSCSPSNSLVYTLTLNNLTNQVLPDNVSRRAYGFPVRPVKYDEPSK